TDQMPRSPGAYQRPIRFQNAVPSVEAWSKKPSTAICSECSVAASVRRALSLKGTSRCCALISFTRTRTPASRDVSAARRAVTADGAATAPHSSASVTATALRFTICRLSRRSPCGATGNLGRPPLGDEPAPRRKLVAHDHLQRACDGNRCESTEDARELRADEHRD